ncbi:MAG TPA: cold shock domain-containing protein [Anaerolineae bacterium]|nr:cold shock domain-containing protein [Anaerolineae bacterium]
MNFRDQWAEREDGSKFIFTVDMQRKLSEAGLPVEVSSLSKLPEYSSGGNQNSKTDHSAGNKSTEKPQNSYQDDSEDDIQPDSIQIDPQSGKYIGRMKWYNATKGYGFIARGEGLEIFFHRTELMGDTDSFQERTWVLYDVEEGRKGLEATEVEVYTGEA